MNLPLKIRDDIKAQLNSKSEIRPFVFVPSKHPTTGANETSEILSGAPIVHPVWIAHYTEGSEAKLIQDAKTGMALPNQTIRDYESLELVGDGKLTWRKSNMVGLAQMAFESCGKPNCEFCNGDEGEAYFVRIHWAGRDFYGVWADSVGAAKRFLAT